MIAEPAPPEPVGYSLTPEEYDRLHAMSSRHWREFQQVRPSWIAYAVFSLFAVTPILFFGLGWIGKSMVLLLMMTGGVAYAAGWIVAEHEMRRAQGAFVRFYESESLYHAGLEVRIDAEGLHGSAPHMRWTVGWSSGVKLDRVGGFILLWQGRTRAVAIPDRAFADMSKRDTFIAYAKTMIAAAKQG
ncbi:hypothetical protein [Terrarubrum flagellatum]|uniref:hypothetical protein n=1 Tax=Terrirubrum flagellatum TaxID=2895980 RepID=UPI0031454B9F